MLILTHAVMIPEVKTSYARGTLLSNMSAINFKMEILALAGVALLVCLSVVGETKR